MPGASNQKSIGNKSGSMTHKPVHYAAALLCLTGRRLPAQAEQIRQNQGLNAHQVQQMTITPVTAFNQLALSKPVFKALDDVGYETPSPIQAQTIPLMLEGKDLVGQAQTGTGKTAAFALPILTNLDLKQKDPQVLVLAPTRELAIQVAEAFQKYAKHIKGFHVLPIYGGQDYSTQIRALQRGIHVAVGTPGRVMDHIRRGNLKLDGITTLVLDEADEMLRMGFIDDVEWILEQIPSERQIALFSATMPQQIRRIATRYLNKPTEVTIKLKTVTAETIRQRFWPVGGAQKLDALTRILESEPFEAMIIFVRTKTATIELSEKLEARGYAAAPINGDIAQNQRERTIQQLKKGQLDILVATDVAARGLDVERISHVINYDIPYDTEAYIHRIGRTGRAGRKGDAILFVAPREKRMLHALEKATRSPIEMMKPPSTELINDRRIARFKQRITDTLAHEQPGLFTDLINQYHQEHKVPVLDIASALAQLLQGDTPLLFQTGPAPDARAKWERDGTSRTQKQPAKPADRAARKDAPPDKGMQRYRIEVGYKHEVKPGNIVGAIANEASIDSQYIGRINIHDDYSLVDLPEDMPESLFNKLKHVWVAGQQLQISLYAEDRKPRPSEARTTDKRKDMSKNRKKLKIKKSKQKPKKTAANKTREPRINSE
jgi:ATP-dependent RNA helicase DeaD